jgi:hypothetical protein
VLCLAVDSLTQTQIGLEIGHFGHGKGYAAAMTNAFGVELDSAGLRRVAAEGVPETVIAAIYLLHERSVDEIASKLRPDELRHVVRLVGPCPSCYPPGTLDAHKGHGQKPLVADAASSGCPPIEAEPSAEDLRRERSMSFHPPLLW